jgi:hypothetical protein
MKDFGEEDNKRLACVSSVKSALLHSDDYLAISINETARLNVLVVTRKICIYNRFTPQDGGSIFCLEGGGGSVWNFSIGLHLYRALEITLHFVAHKPWELQ